MQASAHANLVRSMAPLLARKECQRIISESLGRVDTERPGTSDESLRSLVLALGALVNDNTNHQLIIDKFCSLAPWTHAYMHDAVLTNIKELYTCARRRMLIFRKFEGQVTFSEALPVGNLFSATTATTTTGEGDGERNLPMAVKVFTDPQDISTYFWTELTVLSFLSHPNIVTCYGGAILHDYQPPRYCIFMESMDYTLTQLIEITATDRTLVFGRAKSFKFDLIKQLVEGVVYLHRFNICHRDIKPSNIMIKRSGECLFGWQLKLIDVGVSRAIRERSTVTYVAGTHGYMPPEVREAQAHGRPRAQLAGDIYSLGLVIHDLWSETLPSAGPALDAPRPQPPPTPPALKQLLRRCNSAMTFRPSAEDVRKMVLQAESQSRRSRCAIRTHEGKYLRAGYWSDRVTGNRDQVGDYERWEVSEVSVGKVNLKSSHGMYLSAVDPDGELWANCSDPTEWETFKVVELAGNHVHFRTRHDQYLTVEPTTDRRLRARPGAPGTPETFEFVHESYIEA